MAGLLEPLMKKATGLNANERRKPALPPPLSIRKVRKADGGHRYAFLAPGDRDPHTASTLAAQNLNSGILPTGSSAALVNTLAGASA